MPYPTTQPLDQKNNAAPVKKMYRVSFSVISTLLAVVWLWQFYPRHTSGYGGIAALMSLFIIAFAGIIVWFASSALLNKARSQRQLTVRFIIIVVILTLIGWGLLAIRGL